MLRELLEYRTAFVAICALLAKRLAAQEPLMEAGMDSLAAP